MKNFTKLLKRNSFCAGIIVFAVIIGFALASCGNGSTNSPGNGGGIDGDSRDPALVGTWTGDEISLVWAFNSDGTGSRASTNDPADSTSITWSTGFASIIEKTTLTIDYKKNGLVYFQSVVYEISGNTLTLSLGGYSDLLGGNFISNGTYTKN